MILRHDENRNNDPGDIGRQRFCAFTVDAERRAIRMDSFTPPADRLGDGVALGDLTRAAV